MTSGISLKGDAGSPALRIRLIDDAYTNDPYSRYAGQLSGKLSLLQEGKEPELTISMVDSTKKDTFQSEEYTYDAFNRLTTVVKPGAKAEYGYNAAGYRITKTVRGETTSQHWDGARLIAEGNAQGITDRYTYGLNLVKSLNEGYYVYNGHGDVVGIMDSGAITKEYRYDAFGVEDSIDQEDLNPFRYAGEYFDEETGNIYLRARYYTPATGRFITEDPIQDGLNWYTYTMGNPVNYIDPSGLAMVNVRDYVTSRGGRVEWDGSYATFILNGVTSAKIPGSGNSRFTNVNGHLYAEDTYLMNLFGYHISNNNAKGTSGSSFGKTSNSSSKGSSSWGGVGSTNPGGVGDSIPGGGGGGTPFVIEDWALALLSTFAYNLSHPISNIKELLEYLDSNEISTARTYDPEALGYVALAEFVGDTTRKKDHTYYIAWKHADNVWIYGFTGISEEAALGILRGDLEDFGVFTLKQNDAKNLAKQLGEPVQQNAHRDQYGYYNHYHYYKSDKTQSKAHVWYYYTGVTRGR